jgi:hypothetical protein
VISAAETADAIWSAVSEVGFCVVTHKRSQAEVEERLRGIVDGRASSLRPLRTA